MTRKFFKLRWLVPAVLCMVLAACQPGSSDYLSDYDIVYTNYKKDFDFKTVNTYFLPDSVVHTVPVGETANHKYDAQILASVQNNLNALGWTRISPSVGGPAADVVVLPTANADIYASCASYCWYCYWGYYPGWYSYPPAYSSSTYYGYPAGTVCNTYSTGTVVLSIAAPKISTTDTLPIAWIGVLNGLLEGGDASVNDRIGKNINQMFAQSPYLKK